MSFVLLSFFFTHSPGHPRDLPSFPTRRSSDLGLVVGNLEAAVRKRERGIEEERFAAVGSDKGERSLGDQIRDRKSTRLNSSHLVISYAVFCLKKKKRKTTKEAGIKER